MTKRFLVVALAVFVVGATVAQAATTKPKKHAVSETLVIRVLTSDSSGALFTGTIKDKANGAGAVVIAAHGAAGATTNTLDGTGFFKAGSVKVKGSVTATVRADGSGYDYAGSAKATGGTGVFKGAKGTLKLVGQASSSDPAYQTYKVTGSLTY